MGVKNSTGIELRDVIYGQHFSLNFFWRKKTVGQTKRHPLISIIKCSQPKFEIKSPKKKISKKYSLLNLKKLYRYTHFLSCLRWSNFRQAIAGFRYLNLVTLVLESIASKALQNWKIFDNS